MYNLSKALHDELLWTQLIHEPNNTKPRQIHNKQLQDRNIDTNQIE